MTNNDAVLVFSIVLEGYERLFADCIDSHRAYCLRHGYTYMLVNGAPRRLRATEAAWLKIPLLKAALTAGGYRWVAFFDADCEIRHHTPKLASCFVGLDENKALFMAPGHSGRINSGVIVARNHSSSLELLSTLIDNADCDIPPQDRAPYENGHVIHFCKQHPSVFLLDHRLWNNNSSLDHTSYIQHYSQGRLRSRYLRNKPLGAIREQVALLFVRRVFAKLAKHVPRTLRRSVVISSSMKELLPYYLARYPAFRSAASAPKKANERAAEPLHP